MGYTQKLNDDSIMPWGKYKDYSMANVPADYLIWLYENNKCDASVKEYIIDNLSVLKKEVKEKE